MLNYIRKKLIEYVDIKEDEITGETRFVADLNLNSYDFINIIGKVEEDMGVEIPDIDVRDIQTVGEMAEYLKKKIQ